MAVRSGPRDAGQVPGVRHAGGAAQVFPSPGSADGAVAPFGRVRKGPAAVPRRLPPCLEPGHPAAQGVAPRPGQIRATHKTRLASLLRLAVLPVLSATQRLATTAAPSFVSRSPSARDF